MEIIESTHVEQDGLTYRVDIEPDRETTPDEFGFESSAPAEAFRAGDWRYVCVRVTPEVRSPDGAVVFDSSMVSALLGGVEYGTLPACGIDHDDCNVTEPVIIGMREILAYPVPSLICEARGFLAELSTALSAHKLADCQAYCPDETRGGPGADVANAHCLRAAGHDMPHRDLDGREWGDPADRTPPASHSEVI